MPKGRPKTIDEAECRRWNREAAERRTREPYEQHRHHHWSESFQLFSDRRWTNKKDTTR